MNGLQTNPPNITVLRRAFVDICNGYSVGAYGGKPIYVKHMGHRDHLGYEDLVERFKQKAITDGLPTEKQRLDYLIANKLWDASRDNEADRIRNNVRQIELGLPTISIPSVREAQEKYMKEEIQKCNDIVRDKSRIVGLTAEIYSQQLLNDNYILLNVFTNKELISPLFPPDLFDDLSDNDVNSLIELYESIVAPCGERNIRLLSAQDFFLQYYMLCGDNLQSFFGRNICDLTHYQVALGNSARNFKNVLENNDLSNLSPEKRQDPDEVYKYISLKANTDKTISEGRAPVNMTQEDIKTLGLEGKMSKLPNKSMDSQEFLKFLQASKPG